MVFGSVEKRFGLSLELYCLKCLEEDGVSVQIIMEKGIQFCPRCKEK